jgi:hypothetical protein
MNPMSNLALSRTSDDISPKSPSTMPAVPSPSSPAGVTATAEQRSTANLADIHHALGDEAVSREHLLVSVALLAEVGPGSGSPRCGS